MKNRANLLFIFSTLFVVLCLLKENIWSAEEKKNIWERKSFFAEDLRRTRRVDTWRRKIFGQLIRRNTEKKENLLKRGKYHDGKLTDILPIFFCFRFISDLHSNLKWLIPSRVTAHQQKLTMK